LGIKVSPSAAEQLKRKEEKERIRVSQARDDVGDNKKPNTLYESNIRS